MIFTTISQRVKRSITKISPVLCGMIFATQGLCQLGETNAYGLALGDKLKFGPDLKFPWANANAPKGGRIVLGSRGTFDSLNPFAVKNSADALLYDVAGNGFVFENLTMRSLDEPFAQYSTIAKSIDVAKDGLSITYHLDPDARFSDGIPLTSEDVAFSFKLLISDKSVPSFKMYYADVKEVKALDKSTVKFTFKKVNRELPLIMGELPVLPKHVYGAGKDFTKDFSKKLPIGTGPYIIKSFEFGKYIEYARNPNFWAKNKNHTRGQWNFDTIYVKYYKDETAMMEGFKAGDFDYRLENSSRAWAIDHAGPKWDKKWINKELWSHNQNQGAQGFVFNLRKPIFKDRLTRKAIATAFDFNWANDTLFYKQYTVSSSFFNNSEFNAKGLPDQKELELLNPLKDKIPSEVFTTPKEPLAKDLSGKARLAEAAKLLQQAGWELKDGVLTNKSGEKLAFTFLLESPAMGRVVEPFVAQLGKIGVKVSIKIEDEANYIKKLEKWDFDMISNVFVQSESPGNEQIEYWHSSSASVSESRNNMGLRDPAIDILVDKIIGSTTRAELVTATRALDRVLWFQHILVPNWYSASNRISWWNKFGIPAEKPRNYTANDFIMRFAWFDQKKSDALKAAISANKSL